MSLLSRVQQRASRNGLNLVGLVDAERFDRCQPRERRIGTIAPACGTVVVLGTAGRAFWLEFARQGGRVPDRVDSDTADELAASGVGGVAEVLREHGVESRVLDGRRPSLHFGQLA
ncbi:MAG: hypothetical protein KDC98_00235, partial [Planctomycetes bacterium]|nr:hypothetical protein [Planctomycetota bacterium]